MTIIMMRMIIVCNFYFIFLIKRKHKIKKNENENEINRTLKYIFWVLCYHEACV